MDASLGGIIRVSKACSCGGTMQATYAGGDEVGQALEDAWYRLHSGPNHRPATPTEAARERRRLLLRGFPSEGV